VVIGLAFLVVGLALMALQWRHDPEFFRRPREVVPPADGPGGPARRGGPRGPDDTGAATDSYLDVRARNERHRADADARWAPRPPG
jgi:hypothetical protein